jgi:hypothetical protein
MPRAECVQNSPGFEALHAEFADLDGRRRQRETVVRPYRERLHVQTVKTRGYLRPFEEDSATQGGTWTANAQKHYNAERDRLRAILDDTQAAGLTDCLSSYIAKAEAVLRQEPPQQQAKTPECEVDTHCPSPDQICVKGKCVADDSPFIVFDEAGRRSDQRSDRGEARSQPRPDKTTPSEKKPEPATADNGFDWRKLDDAAFVTHLYATILDRKPDPGGFRHWMGHLKRKRTRDWIMDYFFSSPEYQSRNKSNRDFVIDLYQATHNREPKSGEMSQALARLKRGTTRKDMVDSAQSR